MEAEASAEERFAAVYAKAGMEAPKCQCCEDEDAIGVASIPGIPMSIAWGRRCLGAGVMPMWVAVGNTASAGYGDPSLDGCAPWWIEAVERTLAYFEVSREDFDVQVRECEREMREEITGEEEGPE